MTGKDVVGDLRVNLGLNSAELSSGYVAANDDTRRFVGGLKKILGSGLDMVQEDLAGVAGGIGKVGDLLGGLGIAGAAAGAAISVAFLGAKQAMAFGDEIGDTASKLAVSTDYLQEMRFAVHDLGGEFTDADTAVEGFTKAFGMAKSGLSAKAAKPFAALGLDPKSFDQTQDAMDAVIKKIAALSSAAEQAAVADKLGLTPMLPAIRAGGDAIDDLRKKAHDLGYVMNAELIERAGEANDKYEDLSEVLKVQFHSAMVEAIPLVMTLADWMVKGAKAAGEFTAGLNKVLGVGKDPATQARLGLAQANNMLRLDPNNTVAQQNKAKFQKELDGLYQDYVASMDRERAAAIGQQDSQRVLEDVAQAAEAKAAADRRAAAATREAEQAERARISALQAGNRELMAAEEKIYDYVAALRQDIAEQGLSSDEIKRRTVELMAQAAPTQALADQIRALGAQYEAQAKVGKEAAGVQAQVREQMDDTIVTFDEATRGQVRFASELESAAYDLGQVADVSADVRYGVESIASAINDNDWTSAFANLALVLAKVETAFKTGATSAQKYAAVAGAVQGVGSVVGGAGGAALGGAASGAMAGIGLVGSLAAAGSVIPGIGTVAGAAIGAVLGGLGSLFGSSKAKKKAKAEAAAKAAAEAEARALQVANERRELEIALLEAEGKTAEAAAERHKDYIASLDASNQATAEAVYQAEQKAQAEAATAAASAELQDKIDDLTLSPAELLIKTRQRERDAYLAINPALAEMVDQLFALEDTTKANADAAAELEQAQQEAAETAQRLQEEALRAAEEAARVAEETAQIGRDIAGGIIENARNKLAAAYEREAGALQETADRFRDLSASLEDFRKDLQAGTDTGAGSVANARARLEDLRTRMQAGDADAFAEFQDAASNFLTLSERQSASRSGFLADRDWVLGLSAMGETLAGELAGGVDGQLGALQASVSHLISIDDKLTTVAKAIKGLAGAERAAMALAASLAGTTIAPSLISDPLPAFATGGSFEVGGFGGTDSQVVAMRNTPGELVNVTRGGGASMADMVAAIGRLDTRLANIERYGASTERSANKTSRYLGRAMDGSEGFGVRSIDE